MSSIAIAKYLAFTRVAFNHQRRYWAELVARSAFFGLILLIFSRLWDVLNEDVIALGFSSGDALWYLALTEWVTLALPFVHIDVERAVRDGGLAVRLPQPVSYIWAQFAEALGQTAMRLIVLGFVGFGLTLMLAGGLPTGPTGLIYAVPLAALGSVLGLLLMTTIGLFAIWMQEVSPAYWIFNKLLMVLGGMIVPLDIYPELFRKVASCTPFYAMLYGVGKMALHPDLESALSSAALMLLWIVVMTLVVRWLYARALQNLNVNGG